MPFGRALPVIHMVGLVAGLAMALLGISACAPSFPPIADGLSGDATFKARIATAYPPGSSGPVLQAELVRQGFVITADLGARRYSAVSAADNLPCYSEVRIDWTEDRRGRVARIQAQRADCS